MTWPEVSLLLLPAWVYLLNQPSHSENATLTYTVARTLPWTLLDGLDLTGRDHLLFKMKAEHYVSIRLSESSDLTTVDISAFVINFEYLLEFQIT